MVIYADILFLTNFYIDFMLIYLVKSFLHLNKSVFRILLGAGVGAAFSLISLLQIPTAVSFVLSIIAAFLIILTAFAPLKADAMVKSTFCFWVFSLIFAGFFTLLCNLLSLKNMVVINGALYLNLSPAVLFFFTLLSYIIITVYNRIFKNNDSDLRFCKIVIEYNRKKATLYTKLDTGNSLKEPFSGLPALVAEKSALEDILPEEIEDYFKSGVPGKGIRIVPFEMMSSGGILPAFKPTRAYVDKTNREIDCYIAVCDKKLSSGQFDSLFNPDFIKEDGINTTTKIIDKI